MTPELTAEIKRIVWSVMRIVISIYAGLSLYLLLMQRRYVYYPTGDVYTDPSEVGLSYEDVRLTTADDETIAAWFVPASPARATLLFCHGNGGNIADRMFSIQTFHELGLNVMIFDYQGYGNSTGKPSEQGTYQDAKAAWDYLTQERKIPPDTIVLFGRSLGGTVAAWLANQVNPGALVVESSFTSAPDMAAMMYPYLPARYLCRFKYNTLEYIQSLKCPILIAHSSEDDMIPFEHGKKLFDAAPQPKQFKEMRGIHNSLGMEEDPAYRQLFQSFLDHYVLKPSEKGHP